MARFVGPRTVTSGLILCLDAANIKSYPGSGTTWTDLSGNGNTGTLTNGPTFSSANGGSIVFANASQQYVTIGTPALLNQVQVPLTICAWVKLSTTFANKTIWGVYKSTLNSELYSLFRLDSGVLKYYASTSGGGFQSQGTFTFSTNIWYFCAVTVTGSISTPSVTIYRNSSSESFNYSAFSSSPSSIVDFRIGGNQSVGNEGWDGNIASICWYNRALSAAEVQQNFNALRGRYGI